jgi:hypothetical protein
MTAPRLWEIDHPYYCEEGNRFQTGQHTAFDSWTEFCEETLFVTADRDQNFLIRWDWRKPGFHEWDGEEYLLLFFVLQRKAWLLSVEMPVTEADEPAIRTFLTECAQTMSDTWAPLLQPTVP